MNARLNIFQRVQRQWDGLHAYNAGQVMRLRGRAEVNRWRGAWAEAVASAGLGRVRVDGHAFGYEAMGRVELEGTLQSAGEVPTLETRAGPPSDAGSPDADTGGTVSALDAHVSVELNRPFEVHGGAGERAAFFPFRPFILQEADSYFAGVIYHHWIADSVAMRMLVRRWLGLAMGESAMEMGRFRTDLPGYWRLFGPSRGSWRLRHCLPDLLQWARRAKRIRRIEAEQFGDFTSRFAIRRVQAGWIEPLRLWAKAHGVTLNDVFLAAMAQAADAELPSAYPDRRPDMAMGTIVDLRRGAREDLSDAFGLFLGFTAAVCTPAELRDFPRLLESIAAQSGAAKQTGESQASMLRMALGLRIGRMLSKGKMMEFYRKRMPLTAGISNVNLNGDWAARHHPDPLLEYIRVSPTGPMLPLVFTPTTLGNTFHVALTHRPAVVGEQKLSRIVDRFLSCLGGLAGADAGLPGNSRDMYSRPHTR